MQYETAQTAEPETAIRSHVLEYPPPPPEDSRAHLRSILSMTTDPADLRADQLAGIAGIVVVDARSAEAYQRSHIPGAINIPHRTMNTATTAALSGATVVVVYCDGVGCNASTKGALRLAELGFRVKELLGGLDWWIRDGFPVVCAVAPETTSTVQDAACGCD